jgi:hypothetical protein
MRWTIVFLFATYVTVIYAQTWTGTFTVDSACSTFSCCCVSNQMVITSPASSVLFLNTTLTGVCYGMTSFTGNITYPTGYTITQSLYTITLLITLSSNSSTISITSSAGPSCSSGAVRLVTMVATSTVRSDAIRQYANANKSFILPFFIIIISALKL